MNMITRGEEAQRIWRERHLSDDATYNRDNMLAAIKVTKGSTLTRNYSQDMTVSTVGRTVDFIIDVDQLAAYGEPQLGDRILFKGAIYEVAAGQDGAKPWVWSGRDSKTYRIHTIQVSPQL